MADEKTQEARIFDLLESAKLVRDYVSGISFEDFWDDSIRRDAVAMRLAVIGEAARGISPATEAAMPDIAFKKLRGMRNRIAHDYGAIDFRIVWEVVRHDIPTLIEALEAHLQEKDPFQVEEPVASYARQPTRRKPKKKPVKQA